MSLQHTLAPSTRFWKSRQFFRIIGYLPLYRLTKTWQMPKADAIRQKYVFKKFSFNMLNLMAATGTAHY